MDYLTPSEAALMMRLVKTTLTVVLALFAIFGGIIGLGYILGKLHKRTYGAKCDICGQIVEPSQGERVDDFFLYQSCSKNSHEDPPQWLF